MKYYIGVKILEAEPMEKEGKEGYRVKYSDNYVSWSPKDVFESAYYPMGDDPTKVSEEMVSGFINKIESSQIDEKTVLVKGDLITGFTQYETSACVDPKNFDAAIGADICVDKIKDTIWKCLGFVLQWGLTGVMRGK